MKLSVLPSKNSLQGKRVLLRVDWNIPLSEDLTGDDSLKLERTFSTLKNLSSRGAIVVAMTHLGRPEKRDSEHSTKQLVDIVQATSGLRVHFLKEDLDNPAQLNAAREKIKTAHPGTIFLLENVRFLKGEEKNLPSLGKALASLGDIFINDAFASSHRAHASVVGIAKFLPAYAGPTLQLEVEALSRLLVKPKRPYVAIVAGAKLSTKLKVITELLKIADKVMVGGAMAHAFFAAKGLQIGKSYLEKEGVSLAKKLLKNPKLMLPIDAIVATKISVDAKARIAPLDTIKKTETIGDIGTETMRTWAQELKKAKTIVWNGPVGVSEIRTFSHGSLVMARVIAARSKGSCYGVVGGGDTLPVMLKSGMETDVDHLSTGGGAMLEFISEAGKLPGLKPLLAKK